MSPLTKNIKERKREDEGEDATSSTTISKPGARRMRKKVLDVDRKDPAPVGRKARTNERAMTATAQTTRAVGC